MSRLSLPLVALLATGALLAALAGTTPAAAVDQAPTGKLLLLLDSSGSMKESDGGRTSKIAAARQALGRVVKALPDAAEVGMRVYGGTVFDGPGACTDSQNVVPVGPVDRAALTTQIAKYKPFGETPIGFALRAAAADLGTTGKRSIVLVSDGEATCAPDPCLVAKQLAGRGVDLQIDVVGLRVNAAAERQLRCIARAGHGDYAEARDAAGLVRGLDRSSVRAFRPFVLSGTPIVGGTDAATATKAPAGQYVDTMGPDGSKLYYRLPKDPGETVHVALTARRNTDDHNLVDGITMNLNDDKGNRCSGANAASFDPLGFVGLLTNAVSWAPDSKSANKSCVDADHLTLELERGINGQGGGGTADLPFELVVVGEPAVANLELLPPAVTAVQAYHRTVAATASTTDVVGGDGFNDAPEIAPGQARTDTIRPGEALVYKVRAGWGQSPALTARLGRASAGQGHAGGLLGVATRLRVYSPDRAELNNVVTGLPYPAGTWNGVRPITVGQQAVAVRYRNRESAIAGTAATDRPGWFYFTLEMAQTTGGNANIQAPVTLAVDVAGVVTGAPTYIGNTPALNPSSPSPTAAGGVNVHLARSTSRGSPLSKALGLAVALLLAGAAVVLVLRRRRRQPLT